MDSVADSTLIIQVPAVLRLKVLHVYCVWITASGVDVSTAGGVMLAYNIPLLLAMSRKACRSAD